jgi:GT2 family glycosyltransferase
MSKVAIVILNWNGATMLRRFLPSVVAHAAEDTEVIVADNASTDDSLELLEKEFPQVRTILLDRNWGFAEGYNKALAKVDAQYYVLLNSDVEVTTHWLTPLVNFMDEHGEVAACQPKLLAAADHGKYEYAGACGGLLDRYGYPYCRGRLFDTVETDHGQYDTPEQVLWATGACLVIRSEDYRAAGGLDGRFFAHNEEIDLCWRLQLQGRQVWCIPESKVYHVGGGTLPKGNARKTFLNFRNNLTMLYKCLPESELGYVMRMRWLLDYVAAWEMLLLKRNWGDFRAVYKARRAFSRWRRDFADDRRQIQASRSTDPIPEQRSFSLIWQYYAKGHKTFNQLG